MIETTYGKKMLGNSPFVVIAPHAAGDDLKTGYIAYKLAEQLNGFAIINTVYKKPSNTKATPENTEDFNKLTWWKAGQKYLWSKPIRHHPDMRKFFHDIEEYTKIARTFGVDGKAICLHIHGMKSSEYGIDLGAGITEETQNETQNTGISTLETSLLQSIKKELQAPLIQDWNMKVSIGRFAGTSRQSAIQYHTHQQYHDHALQIEISSFFRKENEKTDYIITLLSNTLSKIFS